MSIAPWFTLPDNTGEVGSVIVVGAGLAGCHTARELARRNIKVTLVDAGEQIATGASANHTGIVKPFVTRTPSTTNAFYAAAFQYLLDCFAQSPALARLAEFNPCGVLQLTEQSYPDNPIYDVCSPHETSRIAGLPIDSQAIFFGKAGFLNPQALCANLIQHPNITLMLNTPVTGIVQKQSKWHLNINHGARSLKCKTLIFANGEQLNQFEPTQNLPITAARGQTSCFEFAAVSTDEAHQRQSSSGTLRTVVTGKHYVIPQKSSLIVGATFHRGNHNTKLSNADHQLNLQGLYSLIPILAVKPEAVSGFCGLRATTPDRLPVVGPVPDFGAYRLDYELIRNGLPATRFPTARYRNGLYVIGGFGSRGIVSAPFCARLLAQIICSGGQQTDAEGEQTDVSTWSDLVHPGRFIVRELRRSRPLI